MPEVSMKGLCGAATLALLATAIGAPAGAAVTFTLQNVSFNDGTKASGSFTTDDALATITDFHIHTEAGSLYTFGDTDQPVAVAGDDYVPDTATASFSLVGIQFLDERNFFSRQVQLFLPIGLGGGSIPLDSRSAEGAFFSLRSVVSGQLVSSATAAVPEPASWATMLAGFGLIGGALRQRKGRSAAVTYA